MAIIAYSKQDEYDLVNSNQDCMGWTVIDQNNEVIGKVTEININTDAEMVSGIIVDNSRHIPAADFALQNGKVLVRNGGAQNDQGGVQNNQYERQQNFADSQASTSQSYQQTAHEAAADTENIANTPLGTNEDETVLPVIREQLKIDKREVESGAARVRTNITERPVEETVNLREEHVTVERRPVNRAIENAPNAFQEGIIEVTEMAEVPVVSKETRVVEEVIVGKNITERQETVRDTVKRTEVDVNHSAQNNAANRQNG